MTSRWQSAEARELAARAGVTDAELGIRLCARQLVQSLTGQSVPVQLSAYFRVLGVRKVRRVQSLLEGALVPTSSGEFDVLVREDRSVRRQRFTIAHELGHLLFWKHAPHAKGAQIRDGSNAPAEEERLCNVAAEEILMPEWFLQRAARSIADPAELVAHLARECDVSLSAALIRCAPVVKKRGELQYWMRDGDWTLQLSRCTGRSRLKLGDFLEFDSGERAGSALARRAPCARAGWLWSAQTRQCAFVSSTAYPTGLGTHTSVVIFHHRCRSNSAPSQGGLTTFAKARLRKAQSTDPDPRCATCTGTGWVEHKDGFRRCKCRFDARRAEAASGAPP